MRRNAVLAINPLPHLPFSVYDWNVFNPQKCLDHRHSFVRRNAVLAINALYKLPKGEQLLQDAPELIEKILQV